MALTPQTIQTAKNSQRKKKRVGRGNGSGRGTYSGRGLKGQRSRSGGKKGTKFLGFKSSLKKMPKLRGFKSPHAKKQTVTLKTLNRIVSSDDVITPQYLMKKGVVSNVRDGVKIVATGVIDKKVQIKGCLATKQALALIEKAGGSLIV